MGSLGFAAIDWGDGDYYVDGAGVDVPPLARSLRRYVWWAVMGLMVALVAAAAVPFAREQAKAFRQWRADQRSRRIQEALQPRTEPTPPGDEDDADEARPLLAAGRK